jgi:fucose permease
MQKKWSYAVLLFIIYGNMVFYGFVQTMRGVLYPLVKNAYGVSYNEQGLMVSLVSFAAVLSCTAAGMVLGRLGFKKTMMLGFGLVMAGMAAFRFSGGFWIAASLIIFIQLGLGFFEIALNGMGVKTFTRKSALMMSLLHFFYGIGATAGPWFGGIVANNPDLGWRNVYLGGLAPVFVMALLTLVLSPGKDADGNKAINTDSLNARPPQSRGSFRQAIGNPLVWRFALCLGFTGAVEYGATNWSGLYLQDVFGLDPKTSGAAFISLYFLLFTLSRLVGGFCIEKIGYLRGVLAAVLLTLGLLVTGFALGRRGIWVLPLTGLFIGIAFPTILAMSIGVFREKAQAASSAIIVISFSLNGAIQYLIGLINRYIGEAWGYRSCVVYAAILIAMLLWLRPALQRKA